MEIYSWERFGRYFFEDPKLGLQLDISKVNFPESFLEEMEPRLQAVYHKIHLLEEGAIANPDEGRMVGHYWLRNPALAPTREITQEIEQTIEGIKAFTQQIHQAELVGQQGRPFANALVVGIGGSSLGPRFVSDALGQPEDRMKCFFIDNTDPDGMDRVHEALRGDLDRTLTIVISKSGGTIETRNGMEEVRRFYQAVGLTFSRHAVSITQVGSALFQVSQQEGWLMTFPMWDWVGGRTSLLSPVGLLPLALQGIQIEELLAGARDCDQGTRQTSTRQNPAALMVAMWYFITSGQGGKQLVVLPYKDRLELLTKYLQQLIMESLGKEKDLDGRVVHQGLAVLGNKGSTDQHSYVQQLLEGPDNFFVTFIEVLRDREGASPLIGEKSTSGDYLQAFYLGTRKALQSKGRDSLTITLPQISARTIGALIALFERVVSMYALLVHINAYHQPAVEMGKKGAAQVIALKNDLLHFLQENPDKAFSVLQLQKELAQKNPEAELEIIFKILQRLRYNPPAGYLLRQTEAEEKKDPSETFLERQYSLLVRE